jgi:hypothetical protein
MNKRLNVAAFSTEAGKYAPNKKTVLAIQEVPVGY